MFVKVVNACVHYWPNCEFIPGSLDVIDVHLLLASESQGHCFISFIFPFNYLKISKALPSSKMSLLQYYGLECTNELCRPPTQVWLLVSMAQLRSIRMQARLLAGLCEVVPPAPPILSGVVSNNIRRVYVQKATEGYISSEKGASSLKNFIKLNCQLI